MEYARQHQEEGYSIPAATLLSSSGAPTAYLDDLSGDDHRSLALVFSSGLVPQATSRSVAAVGGMLIGDTAGILCAWLFYIAQNIQEKIKPIHFDKEPFR